MRTYKTILISSLLFWGGVTGAQALEAKNTWRSATAYYMGSAQVTHKGPTAPPPGAGPRSFRSSSDGPRSASPQERGSGRDEVPGHLFFNP
ncbi:MAG: hypothetical protein SXA11_20795 [Cyanobacteriota bacterium]|nr:hypothetical protein [Cyanobacteriota bacterium]